MIHNGQVYEVDEAERKLLTATQQVSELTSEVSRLTSSCSDYRQLQAKSLSTEQDLGQLDSSYNVLTTEHIGLKRRYECLHKELTELQKRESDLLKEKQLFKNNVAEHEQKYQELSQRFV